MTVFIRQSFFGLCSVLLVGGGFCHKGASTRGFDFPTYYALLACEKKHKARFFFVFNGSRKDAKAQSPLLCRKKRSSFLKTAPLAPIVPKSREEILLCRGSAQKIGMDNGISS
jgi:hypothetical protein